MKLLMTLISAVLIALAMPAWADISRDDAATVAQQASGGRVLAVEKTEREGRPVWRVKVLTPQGEVKVILIDAASGRTL
ncbi:MAG: PepSY domain-containing protein [Burkholderiaceae bacterium]|nr:PepSY domain-containing protein [Burkholderiaceae bacterium]